MLACLVTAMLSASAGLVIGGLLSSSKMTAMAERLARTRTQLAEQSEIMRDLAALTRDLLPVVDTPPSDPAEKRVQALLAACETHLRQVKEHSRCDES